MALKIEVNQSLFCTHSLQCKKHTKQNSRQIYGRKPTLAQMNATLEVKLPNC